MVICRAIPSIIRTRKQQIEVPWVYVFSIVAGKQWQHDAKGLILSAFCLRTSL
jgi:hypothetical protein